jgi:hypothetical protein
MWASWESSAVASSQHSVRTIYSPSDNACGTRSIFRYCKALGTFLIRCQAGVSSALTLRLDARAIAAQTEACYRGLQTG